MKCLRIFATPDGESHFGKVDIATTLTPLFPNEAPFELSAYYEAYPCRKSNRAGGLDRIAQCFCLMREVLQPGLVDAGLIVPVAGRIGSRDSDPSSST